MSLLSSIGNFFKPVIAAGKTALTSALGGFMGVPGGEAGMNIGLGQAGQITGLPIPSGGIPRMPPITTAGTTAGGVVQTMPWGMPKGGGFGLPAKVGTPNAPPGGGSSIAAQLGNMLGQGLRGTGTGVMATKRGKLTGNAIPRGYVERMSPSGVIYLAKQKRRRGISARDLSSFYRVNRLVSKIHARSSRAPHHRRTK